MMTAREQEVFNGVVDILKRELSPKKIILFGSRAKGKNQFYSDFDFAIDTDAPREKRRIAQGFVDVIAGLYSVDVVFLDSVDERFRELISSTGKVLYERN